MLDGLDAGTCLLEYGLPGGRYLAIERSLDDAGGGELDPFSVSYRLGNGEVLYRGTCNVVATDRALALDRISWAPGNGEHAAGKGWQDGVSFGAGRGGPVSVESTRVSNGDVVIGDVFASSFNWDPYSHYDYCYYEADENGDVVYVLYCGYYDDGGGCETIATAVITRLDPMGRNGHDGSGSGRLSDVTPGPGTAAGSCTDPGGGGGTGDDGTSSSVSDYNDENPLDPEPPRPPDCDNPQTLVQELWCAAAPKTAADSSYMAAELSNMDWYMETIKTKCSELESTWSTVRGNTHAWERDDEELWGGAPVPGDWMLVATNHPDPKRHFLHELLHTAGWSHDESPEAKTAFDNKLDQCL